jgi:hypothetical protein
MTKLFSSDGTKDIGPQYQRRGGPPGGGGPGSGARVSTYTPKATGFAAFKEAAAKPATSAPAAQGGSRTPVKSTGAGPAKPDTGDADRAASQAAAAAAQAQTEKERAEREAAAKKEADEKLKKGTPPKDYTSLLGVEGAGQDRTALLTGGLMAEFEALQMASGSARSKYNYQSAGTPQNPAEAMLFLSQATQSEANNIYTMDITPEMYEEASYALAQGEIVAGTREADWANSLINSYRTEGPTMYILDGKPLSKANDSALINDYTKIENFKSVALNMIEGEREMKQDFVYGAVVHGQDMALTAAQNYGSAETAKIAAQAQLEATRISTRSQEAQQAMAGRQEQEAITASGREARLTATRAGEQERLTTETRGAQERQAITARGTEERAAITTAGEQERKSQQERSAQQMEQVRAEIQSRERVVTEQGQQMMAQIDREMSGQRTLLSMQQSGEQSLQDNRQEWQATEQDKDRALRNGELNEVRRATMAQEELKREEMAMMRDQNNITNLMTIAANPAMLYHLDESGILGGLVGYNIGGQDITTLIGDLTASIDRDKPLPNIQDFNAMGQRMQDIESWRMGASRGMTSEGVQDYVQSTSPFSREGRSPIRVGRGGRAPFSEGRI